MTYDEIINEVVNDGLYKALSLKYGQTEYISEELLQEFYLSLIQIDQDKLIDLYEKNQLRYYLVRVINLMAISKSNDFWRKIRKHTTQVVPLDNYNTVVDEVSDTESEHRLEEERINQIRTILDQELLKNKRFWYDKTLFELKYFEGHTYRSISELTTIPHVSIYITVKGVLDMLKTRLIK